MYLLQSVVFYCCEHDNVIGLHRGHSTPGINLCRCNKTRYKWQDATHHAHSYTPITLDSFFVCCFANSQHTFSSWEICRPAVQWQPWNVEWINDLLVILVNLDCLLLLPSGTMSSLCGATIKMVLVKDFFFRLDICCSS